MGFKCDYTKVMLTKPPTLPPTPWPTPPPGVARVTKPSAMTSPAPTPATAAPTFAPTPKRTAPPTAAPTPAGNVTAKIAQVRQRLFNATLQAATDGDGGSTLVTQGLEVMQLVRTTEALAELKWWPALTTELGGLGSCWDQRWQDGCAAQSNYPVLLPKKAAEYYTQNRGFVCLSATTAVNTASDRDHHGVAGSYQRVNATAFKNCRYPDVTLRWVAGGDGGDGDVAPPKWSVVWVNETAAFKNETTTHSALLGQSFGYLPPTDGWEAASGGADSISLAWGACAGFQQCKIPPGEEALARRNEPDTGGRQACVARVVFESRGLAGGRSACGPASAMCCNPAEGACIPETVTIGVAANEGATAVAALAHFGGCPVASSLLLAEGEARLPCAVDMLGQQCPGASAEMGQCRLDVERCGGGGGGSSNGGMCWLADTSTIMDVAAPNSELAVTAASAVTPPAAELLYVDGRRGQQQQQQQQQQQAAATRRLSSGAPNTTTTTTTTLASDAAFNAHFDTEEKIRAAHPQLTRCQFYSGEHCCPALDVRTMNGQQQFAHAAVEAAYNMTIESAKLKFGACAGTCVRNVERLFCAAMCSPQQDQFLTVDKRTFGRDRRVTMRLSNKLCSAVFGSCQDAVDSANRDRIYRYSYKQRARQLKKDDPEAARPAYALFMEGEVAVQMVNAFAQRPVPTRLAIECISTPLAEQGGIDAINISSSSSSSSSVSSVSVAKALTAREVESAPASMRAFCTRSDTVTAIAQVSSTSNANATSRELWRRALGVQGAEHDCEWLVLNKSEASQRSIPEFCARETGSFAEKCYGTVAATFLFLLAAHCGNWLHQRHLSCVPESGAHILVGAVFGWFAVSATGLGSPAEAAKWVAVSPDVIALLLLPPIIFQSGYTLKWRPFRRNLGAILTLAIVGTVISTVVVAEALFALGKDRGYGRELGGDVAAVTTMPNLNRPEAYMFGALISAVDPVATLATFSALKVEQNVEALVCGESLINDAMAIVLFRAFKEQVRLGVTNLDKATMASQSAISFAAVGAGSIGIGAAVGLLAALYFRVVRYRANHDTEAWVLMAFAYASYILAEAPHFSGILACLVCGVLCNLLADLNMSKDGGVNAHRLAHQMCMLAETVLMVLCGVITVVVTVGGEGVVQEREEWAFGVLNSSPSFFGWALLMCLVARAVSLGSLGLAIDAVRAALQAKHAAEHVADESKLLTPNVLALMWLAGLRGAIAIGLALDLPTPHRYTMLTTTCGIVIFTTFVFGGATKHALAALRIPTNVEGDGLKDELGLVRGSANSSRFVRMLAPILRRSDHHAEGAAAVLDRPVSRSPEIAHRVVGGQRVVGAKTKGGAKVLV